MKVCSDSQGQVDDGESHIRSPDLGEMAGEDPSHPGSEVRPRAVPCDRMPVNYVHNVGRYWRTPGSSCGHGE